MQNRFEDTFHRPVQKHKTALHTTTKNTTFDHKNYSIIKQIIAY